MLHGVFLPPFGELADPRGLASLAARAEATGWDGFFLWDHVLRAGAPIAIADPWIALAAIAVATTRLRLGPMVTPIVRRRPVKLARETVTLDHLSGGRLTFGAGLGVDSGRELSGFGEVVDERERAAILDEGLGLLTAMWTGEQVDHAGPEFIADAVTLLPRPLQTPRIPIWLAARTTNRAPLRRAARYDGLFAIEVAHDELAAMTGFVEQQRGSLDGFDVAVVDDGSRDPGADREVGVTWWMTDVGEGTSLAEVEARIEDGPPLR